MTADILQVAAPTEDVVPAEHARHVTAFLEAAYFPAAHNTQVGEATESAYFPATQDEHWLLPATELSPIAHEVQSSEDFDAVILLYFPELHSAQLAAPSFSLNDPPTQEVHEAK